MECTLNDVLCIVFHCQPDGRNELWSLLLFHSGSDASKLSFEKVPSLLGSLLMVWSLHMSVRMFLLVL